VEQSWDSLANFSKRQAGRLGGSSVDYGQIGDGESAAAIPAAPAAAAMATAAAAATAAGSLGSKTGKRIIPDLPMDDSLSAMVSPPTDAGGSAGGGSGGGRDTKMTLATSSTKLSTLDESVK